MTLLENTLIALGRLQGKRECRKEEETSTQTDLIIHTSEETRRYVLIWRQGNKLDICHAGLFHDQFRSDLARLDLDTFGVSLKAQAIAICGLIEADLQLKKEE